MFAIVKYASGVQQFVELTPLSATDPGFGVGAPPTDPGYGIPDWSTGRPGHDLPWAPARPGHGLPSSPGHPGNALPTPPVKPANPIVLPPGVWPPPQLPPEVDNSLPSGAHPSQPIVIPPDADLGIENPIVLPPLPSGVALLIALPAAAPKAGTPPNTKPAILVQSGKKPVLVYVSAAAAPK